MAHYAYLDSDNKVIQVIVGRDEGDMVDGVSSWEEYYGAVRCSYNTYAGTHINGGTPFRKNFPGIGYYYDADRDAFIPPKLFDSWILNEETCHWDPPVPYPEDGKLYDWNEETLSWDEVPARPE